jgi:hypothetical protein
VLASTSHAQSYVQLSAQPVTQPVYTSYPNANNSYVAGLLSLTLPQYMSNLYIANHNPSHPQTGSLPRPNSSSVNISHAVPSQNPTRINQTNSASVQTNSVPRTSTPTVINQPTGQSSSTVKQADSTSLREKSTATTSANAATNQAPSPFSARNYSVILNSGKRYDPHKKPSREEGRYKTA